VAPIIYPLGIIPERFHFYLYIWPPTPVIEFSRAVLVSGALPTATAHACLALDAAACLAIGIAVFRRFGPRAAEYL
jgi:lipopolysaccharide transport system permease protein